MRSAMSRDSWSVLLKMNNAGHRTETFLLSAVEEDILFYCKNIGLLLYKVLHCAVVWRYRQWRYCYIWRSAVGTI